MTAHLARYSEAYFRGLLYLLLQYSLAVVGIPAPGPGAYGHLLYLARLSALALPAVLAFMDGSVQRAKSAGVPPPAPASATILAPGLPQYYDERRVAEAPLPPPH